jgi:hypothetical protein
VGKNALIEALVACLEAPPRGNQTPAEMPRKTAIFAKGGAAGGAFSDELFCRLAELWPSLSDTTRLALLAMAEGKINANAM